jgi:hypothetical protein
MSFQLRKKSCNKYTTNMCMGMFVLRRHSKSKLFRLRRSKDVHLFIKMVSIGNPSYSSDLMVLNKHALRRFLDLKTNKQRRKFCFDLERATSKILITGSKHECKNFAFKVEQTLLDMRCWFYTHKVQSRLTLNL